MSRTTVKLLCIVASVTAVILSLVCMLAFKSKAAACVVLVIYLPIGIWLNSKLCCPHCGAWPRKGSFFHQYCPHCGEPLDD